MTLFQPLFQTGLSALQHLDAWLPLWLPAHRVMPAITMTLNFLAAAIYLLKLDFRMSVYWFCAGALTFTVVFWPMKG